MKKYPIPDKALKSEADMRKYIEELVFNAMGWLKIDGYAFTVHFPHTEDFREVKGSGMCICVEYPYKKFKLSVQQDSMEKMKKEPLSNRGFWENLESSIFHECIHILTARFYEMAERRYTSPDDVKDADEELVDAFTHIIYPIVRDARIKQKLI